MSSDAKIMVKWPSRARPRLFREQFARWNAQPDAVKFLVSLDEDDVALPAYLEFLKDRPNVTTVVGRSRNKVDACNRDVNLYPHPWSIVVLASDDMSPQRTDWAARIRELFAENFPNGDGVLHLNDGHTGKTLNTLAIQDRKYFDRTGTLYPTFYASVFVDNEFQEVSERLGRAVYVDEVVVRHDWIGSTAPDELHKRNEREWDRDKAVFERRRSWGFPPGTSPAAGLAG